MHRAGNPAGPIRRALMVSTLLWLSPLVAVSQAQAYTVYAYESAGETLYLKWDDNPAGTRSGLVTWSIMPAGMPGNSAYCGDACPVRVWPR